MLRTGAPIETTKDALLSQVAELHRQEIRINRNSTLICFSCD